MMAACVHGGRRSRVDRHGGAHCTPRRPSGHDLSIGAPAVCCLGIFFSLQRKEPEEFDGRMDRWLDAQTWESERRSIDSISRALVLLAVGTQTS